MCKTAIKREKRRGPSAFHSLPRARRFGVSINALGRPRAFLRFMWMVLRDKPDNVSQNCSAVLQTLSAMEHFGAWLLVHLPKKKIFYGGVCILTD